MVYAATCFQMTGDPGCCPKYQKQLEIHHFRVLIVAAVKYPTQPVESGHVSNLSDG
jgi:hypothetical protein